MVQNDPCPCSRDAQGKCPCDPNIPIVAQAKDNINSTLNFAGNALLGGSMTGEPNPMQGALGGAISGFTTGGVPGGLLGAVGGFLTAGQARSDYEKTIEDQRNRYMLDRKFMPEMAAKGGLFGDAIQAEDGENLVLPSLEISEVKATKKHKDMDAKEVTDVVPEGTLIFSDQKKYNAEKYKDFELSEAISYYDDKEKYDFKGLKVGDILGDKELTYAEAINKVKKYYPTSDEETLIAEETNKANLEARKPIVEFLFALQGGAKPEEMSKKVPKAAGGWGDILKRLGLEDPEDPLKKQGMTMFNDPNSLLKNFSNPTNTTGTLPSVAGNQIDPTGRVDPILANGNNVATLPQRIAPVTSRSVLPSLGTFPYDTTMDPNQVVVPQTDPNRQTNPVLNNLGNTVGNPIGNPVGNNPAAAEPSAGDTLEQMMVKIRSTLNRQKTDVNDRYATDKNTIQTLIDGKNTNNALQLGNQVLFNGLQSGYSNPALESTSLIEDQFRGTPGAVIDQQAQSIAAGSNSVVQALAAAGLSPGEIASYASKTTDSVIDAQGNLRSNALKDERMLNKEKIGEFRNVIQDNNQRLADSENHLTDFNNKKIANIGSFINSYLTNKDGIRDTRYELTTKNANDYASAIGRIDKSLMQTDIAEAKAKINGRDIPATTNANATQPILPFFDSSVTQTLPPATGSNGISYDRKYPNVDPGIIMNLSKKQLASLTPEQKKEYFKRLQLATQK
jgi:hypothetical protein